MSAIAQVEPMTTARALRGPFDYRLPPECAAGRCRSARCWSCRSAGVRCWAWSSAWPSAARSPRRSCSLRCARWMGSGVPGDLVELAEWIAAEYCSTISRALGLVLPPGATRRLSGRKRRAVTRQRASARRCAQPRAAGVDGRAARRARVVDGRAHRARRTAATGLARAVAAWRYGLRQDRDLPACRRDRACSRDAARSCSSRRSR